MSHIIAIIKKELKSYFNSPIGYIFIAVFLVISSWLFFQGFFIEGQANMRGYFEILPWIFLFLVPGITMRIWSEEKKLGTIEVLMTLPVKDYEVVLGKFFASLIFLKITLILTLPIPIIISFLGSPDIGVIIASYIGAMMLGASYIAIGLMISSFTKNQIVAFILSVAICFLLFILGQGIVAFFVPETIANILQYIGFASHFGSISRGVIDTRDIIYYLSIIEFFLYLNILSLQRRKFN